MRWGKNLLSPVMPANAGIHGFFVENCAPRVKHRRSPAAALSAALFLFFLVCVVFAPESAHAQRGKLVSYQSSSGFTVNYPASWFDFSPTSAVLMISSSAKRVEAVVIPRGAAEIAVYLSEKKPEPNQALSFRKENPDDIFLWSRTIHVRGQEHNACTNVEIVASEDEVGPKTFFFEEHMYCPIQNKVFILAFTQWKADPPVPDRYDIAIDMLRSLRATSISH